MLRATACDSNRAAGSLPAAIVATLTFLVRAQFQLYLGLYGLGMKWWALILGICTLLLVFMWPMPSLKDGEGGLLVGVFRLAFITGGVVLIGPATFGWGALVGVCFTTGWFVFTDKKEGGLRVLLALPLLFFGAIDMVLNLQFGMTGCHAIAAGIAAGLTLLGSCVLAKTSDDNVGRFVAHAAVYLRFTVGSRRRAERD